MKALHSSTVVLKWNMDERKNLLGSVQSFFTALYQVINQSVIKQTAEQLQ